MFSGYDKLKKSKEFLKFKKENKNTFLASCFTMMENKEGKWQFDFYLPNKNKMTSFNVNDKIEVQEEEGIFQKVKKEIKKLDLKKVKINLDEALKIINKKHKENFTKKIIVLQNLERIVWNITLLDNNMKILNIRIDAVNGKILKDKEESLLEFKAS